MNYRNIAGTDLHPSVICLGTAPFGTKIPTDLSINLMDHYTELGGCFIDTANIYGKWDLCGIGRSELIIGQWMKEKKNRSQLVLSTKGAHQDLLVKYMKRVTPQHILNDLHESLKNLQTDYIDLYWLHRDDINTPVSEIIDFMNDQIKVGTILSFGCSNWSIDRIKEAQEYSKLTGKQGFVANQLMWSLATTNNEYVAHDLEVMNDNAKEFHRETGFTAIAYSSQAKGYFSAKNIKDCSYMKKYDLYYNVENFNRMNRVIEVANLLNITTTEVALAYILNQTIPTFAILGTSSITQLKESMKAGDVKLSTDLVSFLEFGDKCNTLYK